MLLIQVHITKSRKTKTGRQNNIFERKIETAWVDESREEEKRKTRS